VKIADIMTKDVVSVGPRMAFKDVVECLVRSDVSGLPVLDDSGQLVGIVTEADVTSKEAYGGHRRRALAVLADVLSVRPHHWVTKSAGWTAADVMTRDVVVCGPDEAVRVVARRMLDCGVKRMPVVQSGELVGMVSRQDILRTFARPDDAIAADITNALATHPNRPDDCHVRCSVQGGVATLTGDVRYAWDEPVVVSLARDVEGVIDVASNIRSREPDPRPPAFGIVSEFDG
jgi:CBS domain-containing protein